MKKNNAFLIVTIDRATHAALFEKAEDRGSTVSQMMRDLIRAMLDGNIKPILRVQVLHPLEPGTYGFVSMDEEESDVGTDEVRLLKAVKHDGELITETEAVEKAAQLKRIIMEPEQC